MKLEQHNFRVDSTGWKNKHDDNSDIDYLENPEGDIWEIASGALKGEQLFTWDAMMRETKKVGKRVPTDEELDELLKEKSDMPNLAIAGYRDTDGSFYGLGTSAYFWSSSQSGTSAWYRSLGSGNARVSRYLHSKENGFSVRCLEEQTIDKNGRFTSNKNKMENSNIKVKKTGTLYQLSSNDFYLNVRVSDKGKLTISNQNGHRNFNFENSSPKTVKAVAELLLEASNLK